MEALSPARRTSDPIPAAAFAAELYVPITARSTGSGMGKDSNPDGVLALRLQENRLKTSCQIRRVGSLLSIVLLILFTVILPTARGQTLEILYADLPGQNPSADLVQGSDGNFYGTTLTGGESNNGTVFKMTPAGVLTTLVSFTGTNGSNPRAALIEGSDGNFYGTTSSGGASNYGTVFKMTPTGVLTTLVSFVGTNGSNPRVALIEGSDGDFYGTTDGSYSVSQGSIFRMTRAGELTTLFSFPPVQSFSTNHVRLVEGSDGNFYGTTALSDGRVFKITPTGEFTTLVSFNSRNGRSPRALVKGRDDNFYGTTSEGGTSGYGTIFKVTPEGVLSTLVSFNRLNGERPYSGLVEGRDGNFYGTTSAGGTSGNGTIFKMTPAGALTTILSFRSSDGPNRRTGLVEGSDGNFYGTTTTDGASKYGTVFKVTPVGDLWTIASFTYRDSINPNAGLVEGSDGNFYGTTTGMPFPSGTGKPAITYKVTPAGALSVIVSLNYIRSYAGLVEGSDGSFYGTTYSGGASGYGTVFKVTSGGELTTLVSFDSANGSNPRAGLVEGSDGNFYGTTSSGGASNNGTVFKMTPSGELTTLASFSSTNGRTPYAGLVEGSDGSFYGTTYYGGTSDRGTIYKVAPSGELTTLVSFDGTNNGSHPRAGIVDGSDGNFYGTTSSGGASNRGTIYKITPGGELTTLVSFGSTDGRNPYAGLVEGNDGNFYGATYLGGKSDSGTIFKVTPSGTLTTLHSFDGTLAARPAGTPIFGSDGKLYGTADTMVIWRVSGLMAPAVATTPPKGVGKTTAELRGTVNANGSDTTVTVDYGLTPEYGSSIAATPAIITGASARPVEATLSGLTPHTTYFYRITATSSGGTTSSAGASFTTANSLPVARNDSFTPASNDFGAMTLAVLQNDSDADGDSLIIRSVTQGRVGMVTINSGNLVYTPAPGFVGRDTFSYTVSDGFASATAQVELRATAPVSRVLFATGSEVPGTGTEQGDFADEALFKRFGIPAINSAGSTAFIARFKTQSGTDGLSVFFVDSWAVNIRQAAQFKTRAPGTEYAVFSSFKDPLLSEAGEVAFIATVSDGDTTKENKEGIWISPSLEFFEDGTRLVARTGSQPPGVPAGARWKRFTSVALTSARRNPGTGSYDDIRWLLAFTAWMTPGAGGVDVSNDKGLWLTSTHGTVLAMREGQLLQIGEAQKRISSFAALKALPNASGQGNGVIGTTAVLAVQVFFTDGSQSLIQIWLRNSLHGIIGFEELARSGDPDVDVDGTVANFSLLTQGQSGVATAWIGNSRVKGSPAAVFMRNWHDFESFKVLAQTGDAAPGTGHVKFSAFQSMAINDLGGTLVLGRLTGRGIFKANDAGLWWRKSSGSESSLQLLAREGAQPPGVPEGAKWSAFTSMALPEGQYGPIFTARLTGESQGNAGPGGVTNANDKGLWAVDSSGELRLVVREGQEVIVGGSGTPKTLRSFTVLNAVPGSPAQRRSFAGDGQIIYRASFTDGSQAVVKVQLP